jgi:hypothetical protein
MIGGRVLAVLVVLVLLLVFAGCLDQALFVTGPGRRTKVACPEEPHERKVVAEVPAVRPAPRAGRRWAWRRSCRIGGAVGARARAGPASSMPTPARHWSR